MLKLTKTQTSENYPLSPQTGSVRKLSVVIQPSNPVDLGKSYLIVKNTLSTTLRTAAVVRNVGWGCQLSEDKTVQFPNNVQLRTASLFLDGQLVEYCEDLNVRIANMSGYEKSVDELRKWANVGKYGFQRVEGAKITALDGSRTPMMDGAYLSPFLERPIAVDGSMAAARYKEVAGVIHMSDIFGFCASAGQVNLAGRTVKVELQFEDRFEILAEVLNYPADCSGAAPTTRNDLTFPLDPVSIRAGGAASTDPIAVPAVGLATYSINSVQTFRTVSEVPFYVGQPICLWLNTNAPAVAGSNYAVITGIALDPVAAPRLNQAVITFKQYDVGAVILGAGAAAITAAQFFANIVAGAGGGAGVCVGMSAVYDPLRVNAAADVLDFNNGGGAVLGAGIATTYSISGVEAVMCELVNMEVGKKTVDYIQYSRDLDTIPALQTYYQKSFQLDPGCSAVFAVAPPVKLHGGAATNLWAVSEQADVSSGVSFRNMLNGMQLYSHDIVFSALTQNVEPLHLDRLEMAYEALGVRLKNTSTTGSMVVQNGLGQHVIIAESVPMSAQPQQFQVRLLHTVNADARTIYVFKAIVKSASV